MQSLNKVQLIGYLPRNTDLRRTPQGTPVCSFTVVSLRKWKDSVQDKQSPEYHNIVAWNKLAEICDQLLGVGSKVFIQGRIHTHDWTDDNDVKHYRTEIIARDMIVMGDKLNVTEEEFDVLEKSYENTLNRAQVVGNLTRDAEIRELPSGTVLTTFSAATNRSWVGSDNIRKESTEFHNVVCWNNIAESAAEDLKKGVKIFLEGRLQNRSWEDDNGIKRYKTEIVCNKYIVSTRSPAGEKDEQDNDVEEKENEDNDEDFPEITADDIPF